MANEERWRAPSREREYESRPGERDPRFGGPGRDRGSSREGFWGRGHDDADFERHDRREYSREDYGRGDYRGGDRGTYAGSFSRTGEEGLDRGGYGWQRGDYARESPAREWRGSGYAGAYRSTDVDREDRERRSYGYGRDEHPSNERGFFERAADEVSSWFGDRDAERRREQDHRGRGPKGYKRSDQRIQEDLNDRLADDPYLDASELEVSVNGGEVTLAGAVDSRQARRRAEDLAEQISGVSYVQNNIRVRAIGGPPTTQHGAVTADAGSVIPNSTSGMSRTEGDSNNLGIDQIGR